MHFLEPAQPESLEEDPSYASAEPVYVDIYANKQTDIENVKAVLQQKLAGAKKTIRWSQDYKGTVKLVHKLSQVQVSIGFVGDNIFNLCRENLARFCCNSGPARII